jgi:hypothetical protein
MTWAVEDRVMVMLNWRDISDMIHSNLQHVENFWSCDSERDILIIQYPQNVLTVINKNVDNQ